MNGREKMCRWYTSTKLCRSGFRSNNLGLQEQFLDVLVLTCYSFFRLHNLVTGRQQDRASVASMERKLADEKRAKAVIDQQLQSERKTRKAEEAAAARAVAMAAAAR